MAPSLCRADREMSVFAAVNRLQVRERSIESLSYHRALKTVRISDNLKINLSQIEGQLP